MHHVINDIKSSNGCMNMHEWFVIYHGFLSPIHIKEIEKWNKLKLSSGNKLKECYWIHYLIISLLSLNCSRTEVSQSHSIGQVTNVHIVTSIYWTFFSYTFVLFSSSLVSYITLFFICFSRHVVKLFFQFLF